MTWWDDAVGRSAEITRSYTRDDIERYNRLAGDHAESSQVPEPLIAGLFSTLLGVHLPGSGTNYLKQSLTVVNQAAVGEALSASVEITSVRPEKRLVRLSTRCTTTTGTLICQGDALVLAGGMPAGDQGSETPHLELKSR